MKSLFPKRKTEEDLHQGKEEFKKLKAENKRQRNYIELIEREVEMHKIMNSTKNILTEDRVRTLPEGAFKRRVSHAPRPIAEEAPLESSYDSILNKLGSLQDQIS